MSHTTTIAIAATTRNEPITTETTGAEGSIPVAAPASASASTPHNAQAVPNAGRSFRSISLGPGSIMAAKKYADMLPATSTAKAQSTVGAPPAVRLTPPSRPLSKPNRVKAAPPATMTAAATSVVSRRLATRNHARSPVSTFPLNKGERVAFPVRKVFVVSAAQTRFGKLPEAGRDLAVQAANDAIARAGIAPERLAGAFVANAFSLVERQGHLGPLIMTALGIPDKPATTLEAACASGSAALHEAYVHVAGGFADAMLAVGVEKITQLDTITATGYFSYGSDYIYEGACGASFPGLYATMARAHMEKHGTTEEQLAHVAVKNHANAADNPKAHFQRRITLEDVLKSPYVAHPLKLYDACPFSDGGAAAVLATEEVARELGGERILIAGSGRAGSIAALMDRDDMTSIPGTKLAARQALEQADVRLRDLDFAEVHDCFTIAEIVATEDLGFFKPGEGARAAVEGVTARGGEVPINPSGGLKAKGHPVGATGLGQVCEVWDQLAGKAGKRQVQDAETALTHNVGATGGSCAVHVFRRER